MSNMRLSTLDGRRPAAIHRRSEKHRTHAPRVLLAMLGALACCDTAFSQEPVDYSRHIKPILKTRCYACHGALEQQSGLRLDTGRSIRQGGDGGPAVSPGRHPGQSLLVERVTAEDPSYRMPPEGEPLAADEIDLIRRWIAAGAASPDDEQPESDPREHWAFRPPQRLAVPSTAAQADGSRAARNPIDAFVEQALARHGLAPRPAAPEHVLLRRVYLDLIGLPPTPDELHTFLADDSPGAWQNVVDRLLDDPRHGERWARHWMDVWRYSDWYGRRHVPDVWNSAPQVWRWRDWIVRSLNKDKGYDRMIREMLAADEISPEDPDAAVATGFLVRNWYALNPNDWMRNSVEHTGKAFLGLTFHCAHCHDHKYDPILQDDYFRLRAFFEPMYVRQDRLPGEADPGPFQDYNYSTLRKIQRLGAVRVFDQQPDAPTWFYTGGDERNRVTQRGSMPPGVPAFLRNAPLAIDPVSLPPRAWYPGLQPAIQETALAEVRAALSAADSELVAARESASASPAESADALSARLAQAEAAYAAALDEARNGGRPTAIAGRQSLVFDATEGRRVVHNRLPELKSFPDGLAIEFQLLLETDTHFNFQLAKDADRGLTAGLVAFETGRILSYEPGSFTEFAAGSYDFAAGERRFHVRLVLQTGQDRCLLTVASLPDGTLRVDAVPVALNGWNPIGDPAKAITFDARTGSIAAIDEVILRGAAGVEATSGQESREQLRDASPEPAPLPCETFAHFDFEAPAYPEDRDAVGLGGWESSPFGVAPATSVVAAFVNDAKLSTLKQQLEAAHRAARVPALRVESAEARVAAGRAAEASVAARVAADRAQFGESSEADPPALARAAIQAERDAELRKLEADALAHEYVLAIAEARPTADADRAKEIQSASKQLAAAQTALDMARTANADTMPDAYTALSPVYPRTSTGRRRALAEWITARDNPLTARVAVNHIWMRHVHAPLVATVHDFGRNGAAPTHPELLDWLAVELMESGWSMKRIHRLIVTSETYRRMTSAGDALPNVAADADNQWLWRMNSGRMEAEVVRDSLLFCGGMLDSAMGGPPLENTQALETHRRSLYYEVYPEDGGASPFSILFDAPNPLECYRRTRSIVPQQALALTNSGLVHRVAQATVAGHAQRFGATDDSPFVVAMFERILSRPPTGDERHLCVEALGRQAQTLAASGSADPHTGARESLVRALLNHNDFVTIR